MKRWSILRARRRCQGLLGVGPLCLAATLIGGVPAAQAVPVATGSFSVHINTTTFPPYAMTGTIIFDDASFVVPGSLAPNQEVNLGTLVGTMSVLGTTSGASMGIPGETGQVVGGESANGELSFDASGEFICPGPTGCSGASFGAAFIEDVFNLTGSLVDDGTLPADAPTAVAYTQDGDAYCVSLADYLGYVYRVDCNGPLGLNVFFSANTPAGTDVTVQTSTSFFNPITGTEVPVQVDVTYAGVPVDGATIVTTTSSAAGEVSSDFAVQVGEFSVAFFDVSTDFTPVGPITICGNYPDDNPEDGIVDGTDAGGGAGIHECNMRLLHEEAGVFVDRTLAASDPACQPPIASDDLCPGANPPCIDTAANRVCGEVESLSVFGVFPSVVGPLPVAIDVQPGSDRNKILAKSHSPILVAILGSASLDVSEVDVTTLAFGPDGAAPALDLTNPLVYWLALRDVNGDEEADLLATFLYGETGIPLGESEACLTGEIDGVPFEGCDAVEAFLPSCGLGAELVLLLPPLMWLSVRRRRRA